MNYIFDNPDETARAVAELIKTKSKEKTKMSLPFNIALSGGSTPKILFKILASEYLDTIPWHFIRLFWVDERCVSPTHKESNFGMTYESLLVNVPIHDANIFRMQGENDPEKEAARYQSLIEKELPSENGVPQFDLILLGMGDDGHTASIFPNDMSLLQSNLFVAVGVQPASRQKRITLTGSTILQAKNLVFLITGASKATVLRDILHKENGFDKYPTYHILNSANAIDFFLDTEAASKI